MPAARNNNFGAYEYHEDKVCYDTQTYFPSGETYTQWYSDRIYPHYCERYGQTRNPLRSLTPGGLASWRDPSAYSRVVNDYTYLKGRHSVSWTNDDGSGGIRTHEAYAKLPLGEDSWTESRYSMGGGGPPWPQDLENAAIAKGISDVKNNVAQLGEDLAEMRTTYGMLSDAIYTLGSAISAVKRRDISGAVRIIRDPRGIVRRGSDLWLQYQYGWKPLVTTVYDLASELWRVYPCAPILHYKKGFKRTKTRLILPWYAEGEGEVEINGRLSWTYKLTNGLIGTTMDRIGLSNPLSLGWQLIPYSFVVDWVLPIGSILDSFTPPQGTEFIGGSSVAQFTGSGNYKYIAFPPSVEMEPAQTNFRTSAMERHAYTSWPISGLYVKSPFSLTHGISSVALFLQNLLK